MINASAAAAKLIVGEVELGTGRAPGRPDETHWGSWPHGEHGHERQWRWHWTQLSLLSALERSRS